MPHATYSSTSTSSGYVPRTYTSLSSGSGSTPSYPRELDIGDTSSSRTSSSTSGSSGSSAGGSGRPLMSYSITFGSNWQSDFGSSTSRHYQTRANSSTRGNAGSSR
ncbi:hypothetical protein F4803DRAFT_75003 [Xylaria telfairii]|nr:hypothetical protein F4803DRAFT_75003 [Xylaria telfairii]